MATRRPGKDRRKKDRMPRRLFKTRQGLSIPPGVQVIQNPAGQEKMSEVLEDFIEPYRDLAESGDALRRLLAVAVLAWDAALLPEDERRAMIDESLRKGFSRASEEDQADARDVIEALVRRKEEHFAANRRTIVSYELKDTGDGYHLSVASTL